MDNLRRKNMLRRLWALSFAMVALSQPLLYAHCQMPCGIYHDDMVYDEIDQYVETMVKAVSKIKDGKFSTPSERNELIRWVMTKDHLSDETAHLICTFFLQQKIKPGEKDTAKQLESAHKMLFQLVVIKQTVDFKPVSDFAEEWDKFKLMFHIEDYECKMNKLHHQKLLERKKELENQKTPAVSPESVKETEK